MLYYFLTFPFYSVLREEDSNKDTLSQNKSSPQGNAKSGITETLQFWLLTGILTVVGSRVSSLVVLEFTLRVVLAWATAGPVSTFSVYSSGQRKMLINTS